jgi:hypothetical protein
MEIMLRAGSFSIPSNPAGDVTIIMLIYAPSSNDSNEAFVRGCLAGKVSESVMIDNYVSPCPFRASSFTYPPGWMIPHIMLVLRRQVGRLESGQGISQTISLICSLFCFQWYTYCIKYISPLLLQYPVLCSRVSLGYGSYTSLGAVSSTER